jgi:RNA polymerase sigma-70 factor (ECF subfamily)
MVPTDGELLEGWRAGDSASGEELFERYYHMVERFFLNKVNHAVQDLVQETFTRCVASHARIREDEQFRLYIFGIAYNVLKEHLRERYRGRAPLSVDEASIHDLQPGPGTLVVRRHEQRLLLEALRSIPVDDQVILELHYWESLTTDEIAEALAIPQGTAKGRLQRARAKLGETMHRLMESQEPLLSTIARLDDWAEQCRERMNGYQTAPGVSCGGRP